MRVGIWREKPTAAFVLSLIGGIFILINGILMAVIATIGGAVLSLIPGLGFVGGIVIAIGAVGLILGILIIIGAIQINSGELGKVRTWSIVVLVLSIISLFIGGGFIIGFILGLVGGILGLVWKPEERTAPTQ